jgi:U3 small nucleolar RNA-associated protein 12
LEVYDVGACQRIHVEAAHTGPVWSLAALPDRSGFVSGSADKTVKFWTWAVAEGGAGGADAKKGKKGKKSGADADGQGEEQERGGKEGGGGRRLALALTRQLDMAEDVLSVRASPDGRLLAVALLDSTIKVYYLDRWGRGGLLCQGLHLDEG